MTTHWKVRIRLRRLESNIKSPHVRELDVTQQNRSCDSCTTLHYTALHCFRRLTYVLRETDVAGSQSQDVDASLSVVSLSTGFLLRTRSCLPLVASPGPVTFHLLVHPETRSVIMLLDICEEPCVLVQAAIHLTSCD